MNCPECGSEMQSIGRGATLRKRGQRWLCPVAEREVVSDERGHLSRIAGAKHTTTRVWTEDELITELSEHLDLAMGYPVGHSEGHLRVIMSIVSKDEVQP